MLAGAVFLYADSLARFIWRTTSNAPLSLFLDRTDRALALQIGDIYFNGGAYDPGLASAAYQKTLHIDPSAPSAHYQLGRLYFLAADFAQARQELRTELTLHPADQRAYYMLGLVDAYQQHYADAEKDFAAFTAWTPKEWAGYNDYLWVLSLDGKYSDGTRVATIAFEVVPNAAQNPWLLNARGVIEMNTGAYAKAAESFDQAASLADTLTPEQWRRAYPGNDPSNAEHDLKLFKQTIAGNERSLEAIPRDSATPARPGR